MATDWREYAKNRMRARRAAWFEGKSCRMCGSTERLEANHVDPTQKLHNPSGIWGMSDSNPIRIAELAKLEALCHDCHVSLSRTDPVHGTRSTYVKRRCRCRECRDWNTARSRRSRAQRRGIGREA